MYEPLTHAKGRGCIMYVCIRTVYKLSYSYRLKHAFVPLPCELRRSHVANSNINIVQC